MDDSLVLIREDLIDHLRDHIVEVKFLKRDGTERVMNCTLRGDIIPEATKSDPISQEKIRQLNEEVIPVWDCDKEGWRSFRVDSVIEFTVKND